MKTFDLAQDGRLNLFARKGFQVKFFLEQVPIAGHTYNLEIKDDTDTTVLLITGQPGVDKVLFFAAQLTIATGQYKYDIIDTTTSNAAKRAALSGVFIVQP